MTQRHRFHIAAQVCRIVLAVVFIFSGFVKTIDPWGTAIKINEYLLSFGLDWVGDYRFGFAIWLCGAELMMGLMLLLRVRTPLVSIFSLLTMTFFTALTFYIARWGTVEDCGCFGDALKLDNWQTFYKNLVLWPMALVVRLDARHGRLWPITRADATKTILIMSFAFGLGAHCYRHLPLIDFLPYKVGVNLREELARGGEVEAVFVCRDIQSGELHEFGSADTTWYDMTRWEFIESREVVTTQRNMSLGEFSIFDVEGDHTAEILDFEGCTHILSIVKLEMLTEHCTERMAEFVVAAEARGEHVVAITASPLDGTSTLTLGTTTIPLYNIDATTQMTMLRAKTGIVPLTNGIITSKLNCRDRR